MAQAMKVRKGDVVQILSGKDRGKQGRIIEADPKKRRVLVENLNIVHRHRRPRPMKDSSRMGQTQIQPGGIFEALGSGRCLERDGRLPDLQPRDASATSTATRRTGASRCASASAATAGDPGSLMAAKTKRERLRRAPQAPVRGRGAPSAQGPVRARLDHGTPRIQKITVNMGVGEAKTNAKALDSASRS